MSAVFSSIVEHYHGLYSLYAGLGIIALTFAGKYLLRLIPTVRQAYQLNKETAEKKMQREFYAKNQKWNRKWSAVYLVVIFGMILPFCLTLDAQPWWKFPLDIFVILMFYDFFYYLTHRFVFHDGGPLMWMHAVHHQQHNPCRMDSSYIHPLEVALGLGLYVASIFVLSRIMGPFHVATIVVTWVAFSEINQHNHDLWTADRFPYKYLNYMSRMHHNHHARFTGGNFATISLFYDWLFGTYDLGKGWKKKLAVANQANGA